MKRIHFYLFYTLYFFIRMELRGDRKYLARTNVWSFLFSWCFYSINIVGPLAVCAKEQQRAVICICGEHASSSMVIRRSPINIYFACWNFSEVVEVDVCRAFSLCLTLVRTLVNVAIYSYTRLCNSEVSPFYVKSLRRI